MFSRFSNDSAFLLPSPTLIDHIVVYIYIVRGRIELGIAKEFNKTIHFPFLQTDMLRKIKKV